MNELDFSGRQVLVVGGSSGIGNGIAQSFRAKGARVHVCGTRAQASDYSPAEGSNLEALITRSSMSATPRRSRIFSRRSTGSMCWCWRRAR
jgi:NAD(P)-dependent dehydrogenase (short-subunit alcohol dehydrogenase family)